MTVVHLLLNLMFAATFWLPAVCGTILLSVLLLVLFDVANKMLKYHHVDQAFKLAGAAIIPNH